MTSLSRGRTYPDKVTEKDVYSEGSSEPFLPRQQTPIGFIYLPPSEQSSDNPYATQAAYNPPYKSTLNDTAGRGGITENNERNEIGEEGTSALSRKIQRPTRKILLSVNTQYQSYSRNSGLVHVTTFPQSCVTYCIVGVVILVIISVIVGIIYFLIQHPKFARAMYKAIEADTNNGSATPEKKLMGIANQLERMTNKTSIMTFVPSKIRSDDE